MKTNLLVTVDLENTRTLACVYDRSGSRLAASTTEIQPLQPAVGLVEVPLHELWRTSCEAVRSALATTNASPDTIRAVAVSCDPQTFALVGRDGQPLHNAILSSDQRVTRPLVLPGAFLSPLELYRIIGAGSIPGRALAAKAHWLSRNVAPVFRRASRVVLAQDYVISQLGGQAFVADAVAAQTCLLDIRQARWSERLLDRLNLAEKQWPTVAPPGTLVGYVTAEAATATGLPEKTPIVLGTTIANACALGAGAIVSGQLVQSTFPGMPTICVTDRPVFDSRVRVALRPYAGGRWCVEIPGQCPINLLEWYRRTFAPQLECPQLETLATQAPSGCNGLFAVPHQLPSDPPDMVRSTLVGLLPTHDRAHVVRALLEAEALALREQVDLLRSLKVSPSVVRVVGAWAQSPLRLQIKADVLGMRVELPGEFEDSSLGTAMCAAGGAGLYGSIIDAVHAMHRIVQTVEPSARQKPVYDGLYRQYRTLRKHLN